MTVVTRASRKRQSQEEDKNPHGKKQPKTLGTVRIIFSPAAATVPAPAPAKAASRRQVPTRQQAPQQPAPRLILKNWPCVHWSMIHEPAYALVDRDMKRYLQRWEQPATSESRSVQLAQIQYLDNVIGDVLSTYHADFRRGHVYTLQEDVTTTIPQIKAKGCNWNRLDALKVCGLCPVHTPSAVLSLSDMLLDGGLDEELPLPLSQGPVDELHDSAGELASTVMVSDCNPEEDASVSEEEMDEFFASLSPLGSGSGGVEDLQQELALLLSMTEMQQEAGTHVQHREKTGDEVRFVLEDALHDAAVAAAAATVDLTA